VEGNLLAMFSSSDPKGGDSGRLSIILDYFSF